MGKRLTSREFALLFLRVALGAMLFALHGWARIGRVYHYLLGQPWTFVNLVHRIGFPVPGLFALASAAAESAGALLVLFGLFTRPAAALLVVNMSVAVYWELKKGEGGAELPGIYLLAVVAVFIAGSGPYSLDAFRTRRRKNRAAAGR